MTGSFVVPEDSPTGIPILCTFTNDVREPGISVVKSSDKDDLVVGETVTYTFTVTNTGSTELTDVNVKEGEFTGAGDISAIECPEDRTLAPGAQFVCTATYVVQQADVDAGSVTNTATSTGVPPGDPNDPEDPVESPPSTTTTTTSDPEPGISIVKSSDKDNLVVGETMTYSFVITNTGNVTLTDVNVKEGEFTGAGDISAIECPEDRTLVPGQQLVCTATYVVQQADVDAGSVTNTATSTGVPPGDPNDPEDPVESPPSTTTTTSDPEPGISIVKSSDKDNLVVGETMTYSFVVTNTGNVTLTDVNVKEGEFTGAGDISAIECPEDRTLAPGAQFVCTATYVVQQADVDAGSVTNTATSTGVPPGDPNDPEDPVESPPSTTTTTTTVSSPEPGLSIVKTSDRDNLVVGETMTYTFTVTNTGNVALTDVTVNEREFTGVGDISAVECPEDRTLVPGQQLVCTATYVVQQADVDAGSVTNTATSTGVPPGDPNDPEDPVESPPSTTTTTTDPNPALSLVKTADKQTARPGETVMYTFTVTNIGNVTLTDIGIVEGDFNGTGALSAPVCPEEARLLAPGAVVACTATYTVQGADAKKGVLENTATATGTPPEGKKIVSSPSRARTTLLAAALPATGGRLALGLVGVSVMLALAGVALVALSRRREQVSD